MGLVLLNCIGGGLISFTGPIFNHLQGLLGLILRLVQQAIARLAHEFILFLGNRQHQANRRTGGQSHGADSQGVLFQGVLKRLFGPLQLNTGGDK